MAWEYLRDYWEMDAAEAARTVEQALTALFAGHQRGRHGIRRAKVSTRGRKNA